MVVTVKEAWVELRLVSKGGGALDGEDGISGVGSREGPDLWELKGSVVTVVRAESELDVSKSDERSEEGACRSDEVRTEDGEDTRVQ